MEQSFKKYCFTNSFDGTDNDIVWEIVYFGNFSMKINTEELDSKWKVVWGIA